MNQNRKQYLPNRDDVIAVTVPVSSPAPCCEPDGRGHVVSQWVPNAEVAQHGQGTGQEGHGGCGDVTPGLAAEQEPGAHQVRS